MKRMYRFTEVQLGEERVFWHNLLPVGVFFSDVYGEVEITHDLILEMEQNFKLGIPHYKIPVNIEHEDLLGKIGNVVDVQAREDGLWVKIELTEEGFKLLKEKRFEYLSAEYVEDYRDPVSGERVGPVLVGVALTNRPAHPAMNPISFAQALKRMMNSLMHMFKDYYIPPVPRGWKLNAESPWDWTPEDENRILEQKGWSGFARVHAYVDMKNFEIGPSGWPENKQAYKLPFAKLEGGEFVIYWSGVRAAMAALLGARGGVKIPREHKPKVYEFLSALYRKFDKEPPEFHFAEQEVEEVDTKELKEQLVERENEVKTLREQLELKEKELQQLKSEYELQLEEMKKKYNEVYVKLKYAEWTEKGVAPVVAKKLAEKLLAHPELEQDLDEIASSLAAPELLDQISTNAEPPQVEDTLEKKLTEAWLSYIKNT